MSLQQEQEARKRWWLDNCHDKTFRDAYLGQSIRESLAAQIKDLRVSRGLSQMQLAERIEVPQSTVSRWENPKRVGFTKFDTLLKIARFFDVALIVRFVDWATWVAFEFQWRPDGFHIKSFDADEISKLASERPT